jgi:hypothetical protein
MPPTAVINDSSLVLDVGQSTVIPHDLMIIVSRCRGRCDFLLVVQLYIEILQIRDHIHCYVAV